MINKISSYISIALISFFSALNYAIFIFPNHFAPAGIDGICTMIQDLSNINIGYLAAIINVPLVIGAFCVLNRDFALKSCIYIAVFSVSSIMLKVIDISSIYYVTDSGTSVVLAPVAAGAIRGILYVLTLKLNASAGGVDIIAALTKHYRPHWNLMNIIFFFNTFVALSSYFVYGMKFEPVICSIIYSFITTNVSNSIRLSKNETVKFEIITPDARFLCNEISQKLNQTATIINAHGAYSGNDTKLVLCVTPKEKAPFLEELLLKNNCIVFKSTVSDSLSGITYK